MREIISDLLQRRPFIPFEIVLPGGNRTTIDNPRRVAVGQTLIHVMAPASDRYALYKFDDIASVQVLQTEH